MTNHNGEFVNAARWQKVDTGIKWRFNDVTIHQLLYRYIVSM